MADTFSCPECGVRLRRSIDLAAGALVQCPRCGIQFAVPEVDAGPDPVRPETYSSEQRQRDVIDRDVVVTQPWDDRPLGAAARYDERYDVPLRRAAEPDEDYPPPRRQKRIGHPDD